MTTPHLTRTRKRAAKTRISRRARAAFGLGAVGAVGVALLIGVACGPSSSTDAPTRDGAPAADVFAADDDAAPDAEAVLCKNVTCPSDQACCFGACRNLSLDSLQCGGCGIACAAATAASAGSCAGGACVDLTGIPGSWDGQINQFFIVSGTIAYSYVSGGTVDCAGTLSFRDLSSASSETLIITKVDPTFVPVPDGQGGVYTFTQCDGGDLKLLHVTTTAADVVEDEGVGARPHVLVRQGASVARVYSPSAGTLRVTCANGISHDFPAGGSVPYAASG